MTAVADGGSAVSTGGETAGWIAGLASTDCLGMEVISRSGRCSTIDNLTQIFLRWNAGNSRWESGATDWTGTGSGGSGLAVFGITSGRPYLQLDGVYLTPLGFDTGVVFAGGGTVLCGGASAVNCEDFFTVRITCTCCPVDNWGGPGWYCVEDTGPTDCVVVELLDEDKCNEDIVICDGPFPDEATALDECGPVIAACCEDPLPRQLLVRYEQIENLIGAPGGGFYSFGPIDEEITLTWMSPCTFTGIGSSATGCWVGTGASGYQLAIACYPGGSWGCSAIFPNGSAFGLYFNATPGASTGPGSPSGCSYTGTIGLTVDGPPPFGGGTGTIFQRLTILS